MPVSPITIIREQARQAVTGDDSFLKKSLFFFELKVSPAIAFPSPVTQFIFPLILAPRSYRLSEPFTVEATPTQNGGLYVEENGIVQRNITLQGNFGWRPKALPRNVTLTGLQIPVVKRSFSRHIPVAVLAAISGKRHFEYLQDSVFRAYADLKRDPEKSRDVKLFFHNPHDQESWLVVPQKFELNREADKRVIYDYSIELLVVDRADAVNFGISEDKSVLDQIKDALRQAKVFADMGAGFLNDVTATLAEVEALIKDVGKVVSSIRTLANAATALIEGVTDVIEAPIAVVDSLTRSIEAVEGTLAALVELGNTDINSAYVNSWRRMRAAVDRLGIHPSLFETNSQRVLRNIRERQDREQQARRVETESITAPTTLATYGAGTSPLPGEVQRNEAEDGVGRNINRYSASKVITLAHGDSLASLAATHLSDARLWQDIALLNGMKPPFIDAQGGADLGSPANPIPGVFGAGTDLLIPTFGRPPEQQPLLSVLGVRRDQPFENQILGTDFLLVPTNDRKDQFDWEIDVEHGSVDFKFVSGKDNLGQALTTRLTTEKGHNPLYQTVGMDRVIGLNLVDVDVETARFRVIAAITADPRIGSIRRLAFGNPADPDEATPQRTPDALVIDVDVEVRGFTQGITVQAIGV